MKQDWRVDPVLLLLASVMCFLICIAVLISWLLPAKEQLFMLVAGLVTAASGSFFTRLDPKPRPPDGQTSTTTTTQSTAGTPKDEQDPAKGEQ